MPSGDLKVPEFTLNSRKFLIRMVFITLLTFI